MQRIYKKDEERSPGSSACRSNSRNSTENARTYGQIMYSCWLKFGELYGVDLYLKVLDRQLPSSAAGERFPLLPALARAQGETKGKPGGDLPNVPEALSN